MGLLKAERHRTGLGGRKLVGPTRLLGATLFDVLRLESSRWSFTLSRCRLPVDDQTIAFSSALLAPDPLE